MFSFTILSTEGACLYLKAFSYRVTIRYPQGECVCVCAIFVLFLFLPRENFRFFSLIKIPIDNKCALYYVGIIAQTNYSSDE